VTRVYIDHAKCEGTGYCVALQQAVFRLDERGQAELAVAQEDPLLTEHRGLLTEAENLCPTGAISVVD
jgi:ferredoxin